MARASIIDQPADQAFAEADNLPDHFKRHHRSQHAGERAEHTGFGAGRDAAGRRRLWKQAAVGRIRLAVGAAFKGADRGERAVKRAERRRDQRLFGEVAGIRDEIARGEIVRTVGDDVIAAD